LFQTFLDGVDSRGGSHQVEVSLDASNRGFERLRVGNEAAVIVVEEPKISNATVEIFKTPASGAKCGFSKPFWAALQKVIERNGAFHWIPH
jgi:hypothetical protein